MNEPKKSLIEAAARKVWPTLESIYINHRKHTLRVTLPLIAGYLTGRRVRRFHAFEASSHRELLQQLQSLAVV